jgi:Bacterial regulatory helix-turn-helix protein, lysR family
MLEKLRLFLVVLEEGSLRRAADRLRISQSAITRQSTHHCRMMGSSVTLEKRPNEPNSNNLLITQIKWLTKI